MVKHIPKILESEPMHETLRRQREARQKREQAQDVYLRTTKQVENELVHMDSRVIDKRHDKRSDMPTVEEMDDSDDVSDEPSDQPDNAPASSSLVATECSRALSALSQVASNQSSCSSLTLRVPNSGRVAHVVSQMPGMDLVMRAAGIVAPHIVQMCERAIDTLVETCLGAAFAPIIVRHWVTQISPRRPLSHFLRVLLFQPLDLQYQENECLSFFRDAPHLAIQHELLSPRTTAILKVICHAQPPKWTKFFNVIRINTNGLILRYYENFVFNDYLSRVMEPVRMTLLNDVCCEVVRTGMRVASPMEGYNLMYAEFENIICEKTREISRLADDDKRIGKSRPAAATDVMHFLRSSRPVIEEVDETHNKQFSTILTETQEQCNRLRNQCLQLRSMQNKLRSIDFDSHVESYVKRGMAALQCSGTHDGSRSSA